MVYDLIVVGAGPAGSTCARKAAEFGLDVLVLDKAHHPRRKACGGGLTVRIKKALDLDFTRVVEREVCGQRFYYSSGKSKTYLLPDSAGYTVRREDFDQFLLQKAAEAGATAQQGIQVTDVIEELSQVVVVAGKESYSAKLVVGADGPNSIVARKTGLKARWNDDEIALCIEAAVPMDPSEILRIVGDPKGSERIILEFYIGFLQKGYAWAFAKKNEFSLGIGAVVSAVSNLKAYWSRFVTSFEKRNDVKCKLVGQTAARIPMCGIIEKPYSNRIMLIGDAGGFVKSNTGEGITYAIESAKIAADVAMDIINEVPKVNTTTYFNQAWNSMGQDLITPHPLFTNES
jgi:geranylgeranyl reductase family protein